MAKAYNTAQAASKADDIRNKEGFGGGSLINKPIDGHGPYWYLVAPPSEGREWHYIGPVADDGDDLPTDDAKNERKNIGEEYSGNSVSIEKEMDGFKQIYEISWAGETIKVTPKGMKRNVIIGENGVKTDVQKIDESDIRISWRSEENNMLKIDVDYEDRNLIKETDYSNTEYELDGGYWYIDDSEESLNEFLEAVTEEGRKVTVNPSVIESYGDE